MKFLDLNGLNHFWTKIKASFGTAVVEKSQNQNIQFVTNHQIVNMDIAGNINVYDWFKKASKGGILEIINTEGGIVFYIYCKDSDNTSYLYKREGTSNGPIFKNIESLMMSSYAYLIKIDNDKLFVVKN